MKKIFSIFVAVFLLSGSKLFNAHEFYLDNGLRLIVVENNKSPIVKQMLWYNVGAADESLSAKGSAHFLEHLMFRGNDYQDVMQKNGVEINAFTSQDYTAYHAFMDISKLELALYLEAKRMQKLSFSKKEFATEKSVVLQERKQVVESQPISKFYETFNRSFWQENPYSYPITGYEDDIKNINRNDIYELFDNYYMPNNATLVIAGNIEPQIAFELVEKYFGKIKPRTLKKKINYNQKYVKNADFVMNINGVETKRFIKRYMAPKNSYALDVFAKYLADGKTSFLYKQMVDKNKLAIEVSAHYNQWAKYGSSFGVSVLPIKDFDIDVLIKKSLYELDEKTLVETKEKIIASLVYVKDNPNDEANILGYLASSGLSIEEIENYENAINAVSLKDIKKAVLEMLKSSSLQGKVEI